MNIYEKLQNVRVELAAEDIRKSGKNSYTKHAYFELADFLPQVNRLCQKHRLGHVITPAEDFGRITLTVVDLDETDTRIDFTLPLSKVDLRDKQDIQNLGAFVTYSRRYLYMLAFDIVQNDAIEKTAGSVSPVGNAASVGGEFVWNHSAPPKDELERLWKFVNCNPADLPAYVKEHADKTGKDGNELYEYVLAEAIAYFRDEAAKENSAYKNFTFDANDDTPFD